MSLHLGNILHLSLTGTKSLKRTQEEVCGAQAQRVLSARTFFIWGSLLLSWFVLCLCIDIHLGMKRFELSSSNLQVLGNQIGCWEGTWLELEPENEPGPTSLGKREAIGSLGKKLWKSSRKKRSKEGQKQANGSRTEKRDEEKRWMSVLPLAHVHGGRGRNWPEHC